MKTLKTYLEESDLVLEQLMEMEGMRYCISCQAPSFEKQCLCCREKIEEVA